MKLHMSLHYLYQVLMSSKRKFYSYSKKIRNAAYSLWAAATSREELLLIYRSKSSHQMNNTIYGILYRGLIIIMTPVHR